MILDISTFFQLVAGFLPLVILAFRKFNFNREFILYLFISFLSTSLLIITTFFGIKNHIIFNIYVISSFLFVSKFFCNLFNELLIKVLLIISTLVFTAYCIYELLRSSAIIHSFQFLNVFCIIFSFTYFVSLINSKSKMVSNFDITTIIVLSSIVIYYSSTSILLFFMISFIENKIWYIHNFIEGSSKLLIAYAFWKLPKTSHY